MQKSGVNPRIGYVLFHLSLSLSHSLSLSPSLSSCVPAHRVCPLPEELHHLPMRGRGDRAVDVELVEEVLGLVPPPVLVRDLFVHLRFRV